MPKRDAESIRGQRSRQRAKKSDGALPGTMNWRLQMMKLFPARTFAEAEADPGFRHIGDVEGIVLRADYGNSGMGTCYIQVTGPHVLALMEACAASNGGQMLHMRLYTCDEDPQWMEHWELMQRDAAWGDD